MLLTDKPDEQDVVKVLDFGLVKDVTGEAEDLTQAGLFMGSPKYMAPEQILRGTRSCRARHLLSLGVMMYEMLCGKVPFDRGASVGTLMAHVNEQPPPMQIHNPSINVSASMEVVVKRCLEKNPDDRYASMKALLEALKRVGAGIVDTSEGLPAAFLESGPDSSVLAPLPAGPRVTAPSSSGVGARSDSGPQRPSFTGSSGNHPAPVFASPSVSESLVGPAPERTATVDRAGEAELRVDGRRARRDRRHRRVRAASHAQRCERRRARGHGERESERERGHEREGDGERRCGCVGVGGCSADRAQGPHRHRAAGRDAHRGRRREVRLHAVRHPLRGRRAREDAHAEGHEEGHEAEKIEVAVGASSASAKLDVFTGAPQQPPAQGQRTNGGKTGADYKPSPY